ncbi:MAG: hypothetical protein KatS3mg005_3640 [Bryobacteraceae bacterium]|nr:MAG: hypothetical protein KatS3mg005_3640 [Bryobacteraceae bacterium]
MKGWRLPFPPFLAAALGGLAFTWLYFLHYLPPFQRFSVPYDLPGYFYSLHDYAFRSLKAWRVPEWDPYIYCGLSFAGNVQASLFYPPLWAAFAASAGYARLPYLAVEIAVFAHVWLAWLLGYQWLRSRGLRAEAAMLGGAAFAFSGYMMIHLQHFGIACGMAWVPLALQGIDESARSGRWRPLWKTVLGGALVFLAGYPPFFVVFFVCAFVYGLRNPRLALRSSLALLFSLSVAAVQLLPSLESTALMEREARYGSGEFTLDWLYSLLLPSYFDFSMTAPVKTGDYYYAGAAAVLGLVLFLFSGRWRSAGPALAVLFVSLVLFINPWNLVWRVVEPVPLLSHALRAWYFMGGIMTAIALLSAEGLDAAMERFSGKGGAVHAASAFVPAAVVLAVLWTVKGSNQLALGVGWSGAIEVAMTGGACLLLLRYAAVKQGWRRAAALLVLALLAGSDYRIHGTAKWFNASKNDEEEMVREPSPPGMVPAVMARLREDPSIRLASDEFGPTAPTLRVWRLATLQGFDPFVTKEYKEFLADCARFESNWLFYPDPRCEDKLRWMGARYYITTERAEAYRELISRPAWRRISPEADFYQVFELADVRAPGHFLGEGRVRNIEWRPERRVFEVDAQSDGAFVLVESYHPGWRARIDGVPAGCSRYAKAFLQIPVRAGRHRIEFEFRSRGLRIGAGISLLSLIVLAGLLFWPAGRRRPAAS